MHNTMVFMLAGRLESNYKVFYNLLDKKNPKDKQLEADSTEEGNQIEETQYRKLEIQENEKNVY